MFILNIKKSKTKKQNNIEPQNKNSILNTENLTIGYQQKKQYKIVFSDINLSIEKGKLLNLRLNQNRYFLRKGLLIRV